MRTIRRCRIGTKERFEHREQIVFGDARPTVRHGNRKPPLIHAELDYNAATIGGMGKCVIQQMIRESYFLRMSGWAVATSLGVGLVIGLVVDA